MKELEDYEDACWIIFARLTALLPEAVVDNTKARSELVTIYNDKDIPALRNVDVAAMSNTDNHLCTSL